jgi:hypothetical protein
MEISMNARWKRLVQTLQDRLQNLETRDPQQADILRDKVAAFCGLPIPADEKEYAERRCAASELTYWAR